MVGLWALKSSAVVGRRAIRGADGSPKTMKWSRPSRERIQSVARQDRLTAGGTPWHAGAALPMSERRRPDHGFSYPSADPQRKRCRDRTSNPLGPLCSSSRRSRRVSKFDPYNDFGYYGDRIGRLVRLPHGGGRYSLSGALKDAWCQLLLKDNYAHLESPPI
jgi:hypothetical protein